MSKDNFNSLQQVAQTEEKWYSSREYIVTDHGIPDQGIKPNEQLMSYMLDTLNALGILDEVQFEDSRVGLEGSNIRIYGEPEAIAQFIEATQERLSIEKLVPQPEQPEQSFYIHDAPETLQ